MTAKEMFEQLGYEFVDKEEYLSYRKPLNYCNSGYIQSICIGKKERYISIINRINEQELKAINKQCKELGWFND